MKTGIFLTARLGSTRLARKHLLTVDGKPIIWYLLQRIRHEFSGEIARNEAAIVITTSDEPENRKLEAFSAEGLGIFYGSAHNIPLRHLEAAQHCRVDNIVAVDGDDILCSVAGMRLVFAELLRGSPYVKTAGLPFGMNCAGYSRRFLEEAIKGHANVALETGWGRIFNESMLVEVPVDFPLNNPQLRFTLDYNEDYLFFQAVLQALGENVKIASDEDIVRVVLDNGYEKLTSKIMEEYWDNFYKNVEKEKVESGVNEGIAD